MHTLNLRCSATHCACSLNGFPFVLGRDDNGGKPAKWRRASGFTLLGFGIIKCIAVASDQGCDDGMIGVACLDKNFAGLFPASRPASRLCDLLECAFGSTQIPALKTQIRVDHADQCQFRKVVALCYQLRADDDVYRLVFNARYELGGFFRRPESVRCRNNSAGIGQQAVNLITYALNAWATGNQGVAFAAFGTFLRRWHDMAAMMAGEPTNQPVLNHPACAIRALKTVTAGSAQGQRRISPSVEE